MRGKSNGETGRVSGGVSRSPQRIAGQKGRTSGCTRGGGSVVDHGRVTRAARVIRVVSQTTDHPAAPRCDEGADREPMPVAPFVDDPEPKDATSAIWRYVEFWKLKDLVQTGQLYLRRADRLDDEHEGLPPFEYERILNLSRYELNDIRERNHDIGSLAQFRQSFYVNCWHLDIGETATMWARYSKDGVAIVSRYDLLKQVLDPLPDKVMVGLIRYGSAHLAGWNVIRFVTTKRKKYSLEREVRAMIWLTDTGDGMNRHFDLANRAHDQPIYDPPATLPEGIRRAIDVPSLIAEVVASPFAPAGRLGEVKALLADAGIAAAVRPSSLTRYSSLLPTDDELKRFMM